MKSEFDFDFGQKKWDDSWKSPQIKKCHLKCRPFFFELAEWLASKKETPVFKASFEQDFLKNVGSCAFASHILPPMASGDRVGTSFVVSQGKRLN